ncbi:hypothetical protein [Rubricoccus marinus]|uniref:Uncharacterized protein n=1 Tax=Rubricoccus marinus TaxID=716817 RepID=A0A259TXN6_9BACT|nr:hypothetical protein [Rubricoccus marinus]OZC02338.1 hypothetical protein BSZ36_04705 [Rubricoccus marinus]
MTNRDPALLALRPEIQTEPASGVHGFFHATLRPILKLQNDTILALVATSVAKRVTGFADFAPEDQRERLAAMLKQDSRLKQLLQGVVWGVLTADELAFAIEHESEVRRRVQVLIAERVVSQTERVSALIQTAQSGQDMPPFSLRYSWNNGSVPPQHRTSTTIVIEPDGSGTWTHRRGYGEDDVTRRAFALTAPEVQALASTLDGLGLWRIEWGTPEVKRIGGGTSTIAASWGHQSVEVPSAVASDNRVAKSQVEAAIRDAVPE